MHPPAGPGTNLPEGRQEVPIEVIAKDRLLPIPRTPIPPTLQAGLLIAFIAGAEQSSRSLFIST
jgi:hypothetical protein